MRTNGPLEAALVKLPGLKHMRMLFPVQLNPEGCGQYDATVTLTGVEGEEGEGRCCKTTRAATRIAMIATTGMSHFRLL